MQSSNELGHNVRLPKEGEASDTLSSGEARNPPSFDLTESTSESRREGGDRISLGQNSRLLDCFRVGRLFNCLRFELERSCITGTSFSLETQELCYQIRNVAWRLHNGDQQEAFFQAFSEAISGWRDHLGSQFHVEQVDFLPRSQINGEPNVDLVLVEQELSDLFLGVGSDLKRLEELLLARLSIQESQAYRFAYAVDRALHPTQLSKAIAAKIRYVPENLHPFLQRWYQRKFQLNKRIVSASAIQKFCDWVEARTRTRRPIFQWQDFATVVESKEVLFSQFFGLWIEPGEIEPAADWFAEVSTREHGLSLGDRLALILTDLRKTNSERDRINRVTNTLEQIENVVRSEWGGGIDSPVETVRKAANDEVLTFYDSNNRKVSLRVYGEGNKWSIAHDATPDRRSEILNQPLKLLRVIAQTFSSPLHDLTTSDRRLKRQFLKANWRKIGWERDPEDDTVNGVIFDLRPALARLGIEFRTVRSVGWELALKTNSRASD